MSWKALKLLLLVRLVYLSLNRLCRKFCCHKVADEQGDRAIWGSVAEQCGYQGHS